MMRSKPKEVIRSDEGQSVFHWHVFRSALASLNQCTKAAPWC
jgi:hypothetical protein